MKKMLVIQLLPVLLPTLLLCNNAVAIELSQHLSTSTEPTPKVRVDPTYPISAARNNREGWATFSFIIEKDGSVSNVLTKESSGSKDITFAAKKALMQWQYQPAIENGEPIQQCVNRVQLNFRMHEGGTKKVTRRFNSLYIITKAALAENNYVETEALLNQFKKIRYMHLSEHNFLQLLSAQYAKAIGNDTMQLSHLNKVKVASSDKNAAHELSILDQRFVLEIKLNQLKNAYQTYKIIEKISFANPYLAHYQNLIERVDVYINSEKQLIVNADIRSDDYWHHALVRNEFT
ncbi:energy transducer TonB [Colwellia sp. C1TZA3]|uniref:energy transducer TonB n=1 Tax=Colwellia sp. C1TZA3 TaxID=2508879 RepID=UPI0011B9D5C7|nr:energy transducer TonB [Colwellia sp. C1TZA3]TWX69116.1 energy transducer TonB [Colwellia sp. C1TZA3]